MQKVKHFRRTHRLRLPFSERIVVTLIDVLIVFVHKHLLRVLKGGDEGRGHLDLDSSVTETAGGALVSLCHYR